MKFIRKIWIFFLKNINLTDTTDVKIFVGAGQITDGVWRRRAALQLSSGLLLNEDNFTKIANWDMGHFVNFWRYYGLSFHIEIYIELYITKNM